MNDSVDIRNAADRLNNALNSLERAIGPLMDELSSLKKATKESESFAADRSRLAQALDEAKANESNFRTREEEFNRLAEETTMELDKAISQVKRVLEQD